MCLGKLASGFTVIVKSFEVENNAHIQSDVCIIGAGPAGITLALELAEAGVNVALIEGGGDELEKDTYALYDGLSIGVDYPVQSSRLRYFGGTSNHWGGWSRPLNPIDFQQRPWVEYSGWTIPYDELGDFYRKAQGVIQLGPFRYDSAFWSHSKVFSGKKIIFSDKGPVVTGLFQIYPCRFGKVYFDAIASHRNIKCFLNLNATEILVSDDAATVNRIQLNSLGGKSATVEARHYVLAMGGLEVPRLLLLSNKVAPNGLGNSYDLVGRFFMEHLVVGVADAMAIDDENLRDSFEFTNRVRADDVRAQYWETVIGSPGERRPVVVYPGMFIAAALQRQQRLLNSTLVIGSGVRDLAFPTDSPILELLKGFEANGQDTLIPSIKKTRVSIIGEQAPNPESRVTLSDEVDIFGQRKLQLNWKITQEDLDSIESASLIYGSQFALRGSMRLKLIPRDLWRPHGGMHHMGTTRMHDDSRFGVVDKNLRVYGVRNLFIAGSAVFPTSGAVHPTLTIVGLSLRLARHLTEAISRT